MSKIKHTPGPWVLSFDNRIEETKGLGMRSIKILSPWVEGAWEDDPEAIANMKLMVAAPELLEACIKTKALMLKTGVTVDNADQYNILNNIIKKATE
jgi:hypothetical protein